MQGRIRGGAESIQELRRVRNEAAPRATMAAPADRAPGSAATARRTLWARALSAFVYAGLLINLVYPYADYDWGWHYRYGEYFLTHGRVLRQDIFSWTMAGYEWINHSWLFDPFLYVLYNRFGFIGLGLAGGVTSLLAFYLCVRRAHFLYWQAAILSVFFVALSKEAIMQGLRGQVIGLLLAAILLDLLSRMREGRAWPYWALPGLFCLWVNMHGSFLLGLVVFGVHVACDFAVPTIQGKGLPRHWFALAGSFLASALATLVNPFTYDVYLKGEVVSHVGNPVLGYVVEWMRPDFSEFIGMVFLAYVALLAYGFLARRRLTDLPWLVIAGLTFYLAVSSRRHGPMFLVLTLPFAATVVKDLRLRVEGIARTSIAVAAIVAIFCLTVFVRRGDYRDLLDGSFQTYCTYGSECSEGLVQHLLRQPPVGRGFNFYDWGGYLIGRGVQTKVFIDGRMHLWGRGDYRPMADYRAMYVDRDFEAFDRYQFDWFIVPRRSDFLKALAAYTSPLTRVKEDNLWFVAYQDERALYAVRRKRAN